MDFDKQFLLEDDRRILENVSEMLKLELSDILIVTARPQLYEGMGVRRYSDLYPGRGLRAGVHAALHHAWSQYIYLLACNMLVVNLPFVCHMKQTLQETGNNSLFRFTNASHACVLDQENAACFSISRSFTISPPCRKPPPVPIVARFAMTVAPALSALISAATAHWTS